MVARLGFGLARELNEPSPTTLCSARKTREQPQSLFYIKKITIYNQKHLKSYYRLRHLKEVIIIYMYPFIQFFTLKIFDVFSFRILLDLVCRFFMYICK